jgi:hypothetical protein
VRITDITSCPTISSHGRSGLTNRLPRLREYISSKNDSETPSCPRKRTSHSSTAPMKMPGASDRTLFVGARYTVTNAHMIIVTVG